MNIKLYISVFFFFMSLNLIGQVKDSLLHQKVLNNNITDSLYTFGKWNEKGETEIRLKYLGILKTVKGNFKIMTSCCIWGLSQRATSRILIFSEGNKYLGNYYLMMTYDLPEKIENNQIIFLHSKSDDCDKTVITCLSFENGIPDKFFLECKNGYGDIYTFEKD